MTDPEKVALRLIGKKCGSCVFLWGLRCPKENERSIEERQEDIACPEHMTFGEAFYRMSHPTTPKNPGTDND